MKLIARLLGLGLAAALLLGVWGYHGATRTPVVVPVSLKLTGLPPGTNLRVLLFSDTHYGRPDMTGERLDALVDQANALKPDLILLAGDYNGGKLITFPGKPHLEPAVQPFARLHAPLGVYAVMGNHETMKWTPLVLARQKTPRLLINESVDLGPLVLAGINSVRHGADLAGTLARIPPGPKPILVLRHEGDWMKDAPPPPGRPVLALAAHTHGGQILLPLIGSPGELVLGGTACRRGFCRINGWPLYVTSGVGTSWLPLRIGVPPEMVMLTISPCTPGDLCPFVFEPKR
jgi:predicted MPP superfamily phosphohydrolase